MFIMAVKEFLKSVIVLEKKKHKYVVLLFNSLLVT